MRKVVLSLIILAFILSAPAFGATRFYLPSSGAVEVSPTWETTWALSAEADRVRCVVNKVNSAMTSKTMTYRPAGANTYCLNRMYVSDPIAAQVIGGQVSGEVSAFEVNGNVNAYSAVIIKVVSNDGLTLRGILLNITVGATEFTNTQYGRITPPISNLSSVTAQAGDRIVIEVGIRRDNQNSNANQRFGDSGGGDLTFADGTEVNDYNSWVEFSQDIIFPSVTVDE